MLFLLIFVKKKNLGFGFSDEEDDLEQKIGVWV